MIERLKQAFTLAEQCSAEEQEALADLLLEELRAARKWEALFTDPRSDALLERLTGEAIAEDEAGETEELSTDSFA